MKRALAAALAGLVLVIGLGACQKVTRSVSTSISPCFRILPLAKQAVGNQGTIVDIARLRGDAVTTFDRVLRGGVAPHSPPAPLAPSGGAGGAGAGVQPGVGPNPLAGRRDVCVVAFRGTFDPSRMQHLLRNQPGRYAIVTVGSLTQRVRMVVLTDVLPPPLHAHRGLPS